MSTAPDISDFTGRGAQTRRLVSHFSGRSAEGPPPAAVICGAPGVGKTALAIHVAHEIRAGYPDGQLYADLTGDNEARRDPADILTEFLQVLGVTATDMPRDQRQCAALYRSRLADRRILVVLDDAQSVAQVGPLLPPTGGCAVIVTSRRRLMDFPGALNLELDVFELGEALRLLTRIAGHERVLDEPSQATDIVRRCGRLPLAIRIAGAKLASRRAWSLSTLADRMRDDAGRLSELEIGELGVRASIARSVCLLPREAAQVFRLIGLLGARPIPGWVAGVLLGDESAGSQALEKLVDASLLQLVGGDGGGQLEYRMHGLIRCYALEAAVDADPAELRRIATARLSFRGIRSWNARATPCLSTFYGREAGMAFRRNRFPELS